MEAVVSWLRDRFEKNPNVLAEVADAYERVMKHRVSNEVLPSRLVRTLKGIDCVRVLDGAQVSLLKKNSVLAANNVWAMMLRLLPLLSDWESLVGEASTAFSNDINAIELPLYSEDHRRGGRRRGPRGETAVSKDSGGGSAPSAWRS